jgi:hypothetical protein
VCEAWQDQQTVGALEWAMVGAQSHAAAGAWHAAAAGAAAAAVQQHFCVELSGLLSKLSLE